MQADLYLAEICRLYVLIALSTAAVAKSMHFRAFRDSLGDAFPSFGHAGARLVAIAIVIGEWSAALSMLMGGGVSRAGLILALALFVSLTAVVAAVVAKGLSVRCNCFGASQQRISGYDLIRNSLLIAAAGYGLSGASASGTDGAMGGFALPAYVPMAVVASMLFQLSIRIREIVDLLRIRAEDL